MPDKELEVSCPGCSAVFNVPAELAGEIAECSECGAVFEIPKPEEIQQETGTETGAIKGKITEESETATNTVKLSRTSIGMIPTLKDTFTFGDPQKPTIPSAPPPPRPGSGTSFAQQQRPLSPPKAQPPLSGQGSFPIPPRQQQVQQQSAPSLDSPQFKTQLTGHAMPPPPPTPPSPPPPVSNPPPRPPSATSSAQKMTFKKPVPPPSTVPQAVPTQQAGQTHIQNIQLPPWTRIQLRPDEQLYGFREISPNSMGIAIGSSSPILLCLLAVFLAKQDHIISYGIVAAIWLITFILIAIIASKAKTFVAFTSLRVIIISGSKRMEIGK